MSADKSAVNINVAELSFLRDEFIKGPSLVPIDRFKDYVHFDADKKVILLGAEPELRNHKCHDIEAIINTVVNFRSLVNVVVWYSETGITVVIDDATRKNFSRFNLTASNQFAKLRELESSKQWLSQKQLIRLLKFDLVGCVSGDEAALIEILSQVKFNASENTATGVQRGKSSLGKQLSAEVTGASAIPEYVIFQVPVFRELQSGVYLAPVRCYLEIEEQNSTFRFLPLPGEIDRAVAQAKSTLGYQLASMLKEAKCEDVPLYMGEHK